MIVNGESRPGFHSMFEERTGQDHKRFHKRRRLRWAGKSTTSQGGIDGWLEEIRLQVEDNDVSNDSSGRSSTELDLRVMV